MDGIHDVGGKLGFGSIAVTNDEEPPFHADWEARMWGIANCYTRPASSNSPKFRYTRELEDPVRYLTRPYFDQWYKAHACILVGSGAISIEELASGEPSTSERRAEPPLDVAGVAVKKSRNPPSEHIADLPARYRAGDRVFARMLNPCGHCRLPGYVRGRQGVVTATHGGHPLDDALVRGEIRTEALYTVRFLLSDLYPEQQDSHDCVHLDLWESYLVDEQSAST